MYGGKRRAQPVVPSAGKRARWIIRRIPSPHTSHRAPSLVCRTSISGEVRFRRNLVARANPGERQESDPIAVLTVAGRKGCGGDGNSASTEPGTSNGRTDMSERDPGLSSGQTLVATGIVADWTIPVLRAITARRAVSTRAVP